MQSISISFVSLACVVAMVAAYGGMTTGGFSGYTPYSGSYGYMPVMPIQHGGGGFGMTGGSMGLGGGMSSLIFLIIIISLLGNGSIFGGKGGKGQGRRHDY